MNRRRLLSALFLLGCNVDGNGSDAGTSTPDTILDCPSRGCIWLDANKLDTIILDAGALERWKSALRFHRGNEATPLYVGPANHIDYEDGATRSLLLGRTHGILRVDGFGFTTTEFQYVVAAYSPSDVAILSYGDPLVLLNDSDAGLRACFDPKNMFGDYPPPPSAVCLESATPAWRDGAFHMFGIWRDHERDRLVFMVDGVEAAVSGAAMQAYSNIIIEIGGRYRSRPDAGGEMLDYVMEGRVSEIFATTSAVSSIQLSAIKKYLGDKYRLTF